MPDITFPPRREVAKFALIASAALGTLAASRYLGARKVSAAERMAEALLDTERMRETAAKPSEGGEAWLAACASYFVRVAYRAAEGLGVSSGPDDPLGYSRTHTHPYTRAAATVLTEGAEAEPHLTYAVHIPDVGEVRGIRRVAPIHMAGLSPARPALDTLQIVLHDDFTAQIESRLEVAEMLATGRVRLFGDITLRDSKNNVGLLNIGYDGTVSGTITRDARIIGRFEGKIPDQVHFKQYHLEAGD